MGETKVSFGMNGIRRKISENKRDREKESHKEERV
jgi:hypothetical protein